jgi:hypothetical protein
MHSVPKNAPGAFAFSNLFTLSYRFLQSDASDRDHYRSRLPQAFFIHSAKPATIWPPDWVMGTRGGEQVL